MEFAKALSEAKQQYYSQIWRDDPNHDGIIYISKYSVKRQLFLLCLFHWIPNLSAKAAAKILTPPPQRHGEYLAKILISFRTVVSWIILDMRKLAWQHVSGDCLILSRDGFEESISLDSEYSRGKITMHVSLLHSNYAEHGWCYPEEYAIAELLCVLPWTLAEEIKSCLRAVSSKRLLKQKGIFPSWADPRAEYIDKKLWK